MKNNQRKSKSLQSWASTLMNQEIVDNFHSWKYKSAIFANNFKIILYFEDYSTAYKMYFYRNLNENNAEELLKTIEQHRKDLYNSHSVFVDFKYLNFGYSELLEFLKSWKYNKFFKNNGLTLDVSEHINEITKQPYIQLHIHKLKGYKNAN